MKPIQFEGEVEYRVIHSFGTYYLYWVNIKPDGKVQLLNNKPLWISNSLKEMQEDLRKLIKASNKPVLDMDKQL